jgi:hypothetical protein
LPPPDDSPATVGGHLFDLAWRDRYVLASLSPVPAEARGAAEDVGHTVVELPAELGGTLPEVLIAALGERA